MFIDRKDYKFAQRLKIAENAVTTSKATWGRDMLRLAKIDPSLKNFPWTAQREQDFLDIVWLFSHSEFHRKHSYIKITELILPPLALDYYAIYRENNKPLSYISWGFFGVEAEKNTFIKQTRPITDDDYNSGPQPWVVDLVAPWQHINQVIEIFANWGAENNYDGVTVKLIRVRKNKRIGKFKFRADRKWNKK